MSDLQAIADRIEIEALRGDLTDSAMMRDRDGFVAVFASDGAWRMPHAGIEFTDRSYEILYFDSTPLTGSVPDASTVFELPVGVR